MSHFVKASSLNWEVQILQSTWDQSRNSTARFLTYNFTRVIVQLLRQFWTFYTKEMRALERLQRLLLHLICFCRSQTSQTTEAFNLVERYGPLPKTAKEKWTGLMGSSLTLTSGISLFTTVLQRSQAHVSGEISIYLCGFVHRASPYTRPVIKVLQWMMFILIHTLPIRFLSNNFSFQHCHISHKTVRGFHHMISTDERMGMCLISSKIRGVHRWSEAAERS